MRPLRDLWSAKVVGHLHYMNITQKEFAEYMGISEPYLSSVLTGKRYFRSEYAKQQAQKRITRALESLEYDRLHYVIPW